MGNSVVFLLEIGRINRFLWAGQEVDIGDGERRGARMNGREIRRKMNRK